MKRNLKAPQSLVSDAQQIMTGSYHTVMMPPSGEELEILDVGACFGAYTVWACQMFENANITAVEPNPEMIKMLEENLETFGFTNRVKIIKAALGDRTGEAELVHGVNPGCFTVTPDGPMHNRVKDKTEMVAMEDAALLPILYDIVKVDTEGSEVAILSSLDLSQTRLVAYEFHRPADRILLDEMMRDNGLTLVRGWLTEPDTGTMIWLREEQP